MKYLLPAPAIGVLAVSGWLRTADVSVEQPRRQVEVRPARTQAPKVQEATVETVRWVPTPAPEVTPVSPAQTGERSMASAEAATQQMETMLKDELDLTEDQQARISFCLRDREIELHECHASIRRSGVFVPLDDGKTLLGMKEGWYRRIDSVLDSRQHERFSVLVDQGLLRPGTDVGVNLDEVIVVR